ncbi:MAG: sialate O-acetylesterase [Verrucomicrobia bacterium]|nr:sialate O-acetylesterase [Verrucomicrobiota bacterium]
MKGILMWWPLVAGLMFLPSVAMSQPSINVSSMFGDHAVMQREMPVPVWGRSEPGAKLTVEFAGQKKTITASKDGKWLVKLDPLKANVVPQEMVIADGAGNKVAFKDILVGEVWICSGQSNMQYGWGKESHPMFNWGGEANLAALVADARTKPIRGFTVLPDVAFAPNDQCKGAWSADVSGSAVAFGFSYHLFQQLKVPVGVVVTCWGSSSIEGWTPRELTGQLPHFKAIMEGFDANTNAQSRVRAAIEKGIQHGNVFVRQQPNLLYNAMLHPVIPYASRGMVWYQGEANAAKPDEYAQSLPVWINRLRAEWERDDFHFLVVMLPGYGDKIWPWFREVQLGILKTPHTSVANTIDLGDEKNIHPADKAPICERLALLARRDVYGEKIEAQGPIYKGSSVKGNRVVVEFDHADGLKTTDGAAPAGFLLAGADKKWLPAKAVLNGKTVELEAEGLASPALVRYAFDGKPTVNLVNGADLPAYPFRTDEWPQ